MPQWNEFKGYVHEAAKAHFDGRFSANKAYLCGPPPMINAAISCLMQGRLYERDIFMARFYSAANGARSKVAARHCSNASESAAKARHTSCPE